MFFFQLELGWIRQQFLRPGPHGLPAAKCIPSICCWSQSPIFLFVFCVIVCWCFKNWMIHDESIESLFGGRCVFFTMSTLECADGLFFNHLRVHLFQRHGDDHAAEWYRKSSNVSSSFQSRLGAVTAIITSEDFSTFCQFHSLQQLVCWCFWFNTWGLMTWDLQMIHFFPAGHNGHEIDSCS